MIINIFYKLIIVNMYKYFLCLSLVLIVTITQESCCSANTISIVGNGLVNVTPDIAQINVGVVAFGHTSSIALSNANKQIYLVLAYLKANNIPAANFSTSSINLNPQYDYSTSVAVIVGQLASQTLSLTLGNINNLGNFISGLGAINNVTIDGLSFSKSDTQAAQTLARKAAITDAKNKLQQYQTLSGKTAKNVQQVIDLNQESYLPFSSNPNLYLLASKTQSVPYGNVQVNAGVQVIWSI